MEPGADGWFSLEAEAGAGAHYRFRLPGGVVAPDPASRGQSGDVHGWSVVADPAAYAWKTQDWLGRPWREAVIWEAHCGVLGGFSGVVERLADLAALGFTAIELMPIADFAGRRNWGYDGVLPYAPDEAYGSPDELKALIDAAHSHGLMVFLDVVYNHFGPDGNYLPVYAPQMFRDDVQTPWGGAVAVNREPTARFFIDNALYWLNEFRFDGLRFDAVHAIGDNAFLDRLAREIRAGVDPRRHVHLVLENESNDPDRLVHGYDAQWNDDLHNVLHVLLTGETGAYYQDFADRPAERLARALAEGFIYQGESSPNHDGAPRGAPSGHLAPTAFVGFLQNHDQVGNRAFGERLTQLVAPEKLRAAMALLLLGPQIPLVFMGEESGSTTPFLFFTDFDGDLAEAVREGRRREFAKFPDFADPARRAAIPDPNAEQTFAASRPTDGPDADRWRALFRDLLALRRVRLAPLLDGAVSLGATVLGDKAVRAAWRLADGARLTLAVNLGDAPVPAPDLPASQPLAVVGERPGHALPPAAFVAWLEPADER